MKKITNVFSFVHASKKVVAISVAIIGLLAFSHAAMAQEPVYFADANLKAAVESALGISNPTPTDMLLLTSLIAGSCDIIALTGIEYAANLTRLYLSYNEISDITALSGLTNLTELYLYYNQISDISALSGLVNITQLWLLQNQISDISALSGLMHLKDLVLSSNPLNLDAYCTYLPLIRVNNPDIALWIGPCPYADCDEDETPDVCDADFIDNDGDGADDGEGVGHGCDNCSRVANPDQEDSYPPQGNGIGDACDCEGNFACDLDVDGTDASIFKLYFGRSTFNNPCTALDPCRGDFNCDGDADGSDASLFKADFGRSGASNPCPACVVGDWCNYAVPTSTTTIMPATTTTTALWITTTTMPVTTTTTTPPPCELQISPPGETIYTWEHVQFSATLDGACNPPCYNWEVVSSIGSTIDSNGFYTAGGTAGSDTVTVNDNCNMNISDSAIVEVLYPITSTTTTSP
jgi:hypothetical protein